MKPQTRGDGILLTELNFSPLSWAIPRKILEMADVETSNNHATPVKEG